jgi:hypothetical protein
MLTLAHHAKAENSNNTVEPLAENAVFHRIASSATSSHSFALQYPKTGKLLSMTSEVMQKRGV